MTSLARQAPAIFNEITNARRIVDFRNQLTHSYKTIDDTIVWAIGKRDVPVLEYECNSLKNRLEQQSMGVISR